MKKFLSLLVAAVLLVSSSSFVFADSGKNHGKAYGKAISSKATSEDSIRSLKEQIKTFRNDKSHRTEILKKIAELKKQMKDKEVDVYVDGTEVEGCAPVMRTGKALLPLNPILKALKAAYELKKDASGNITGVVIKKSNITLTLTIGSDKILVTDELAAKTSEFKLEYKVENTRSGILVPMGVIQKLLRQKIDFDNDSGYIDIEDDKPVNLALNMPVAATSTYGTGFSATYAVDGKADTRWSSEFTTVAALTVDLGAVKNIGKVKLTWEAAYARVYAVQVSNDNLVWSDAVIVTNGDGGTDELAFGPLNARYVRLDLRERANPEYGYSLYEFEVYSGDKKVEGTISGKVENLMGTANLTAEGVSDWAHWGLSDATSFNRKAGVTQQISNFSVVGNTAPTFVPYSLANYAWTDGTPTANASAASGAVYVKGQGNGFTLTVPADLAQRTLKIYVGALDAKGKLEAKTSDGSAAYTGFIDSPASMRNAVFTIGFKAASAGQTLTVRFTVDNAYDAAAGDISLQAATLK